MGMLPAAALPRDFAERGRRAWAQYQREHDVTPQRGQVASIDPASGRVWFGEDALEAVATMNADGIDPGGFHEGQNSFEIRIDDRMLYPMIF